MTGAGGIGKQKSPVKEKCTSSLNVTLANYGGLPFAVCCSRPYIVYQTVKKLHSCLIACVGATIGRPPTYRSNAFSGIVSCKANGHGRAMLAPTSVFRQSAIFWLYPVVYALA